MIRMEIMTIKNTEPNTPRAGLIANIKTAVNQYLELSRGERKENLSSFIVSQVHYEYTYLSSLYSASEGQTIEQYYIHQRIEKAKAWLRENSYTITEIARNLGYGYVQYFSNQFRQITGMTPSHFKQLNVGVYPAK